MIPTKINAVNIFIPASPSASSSPKAAARLYGSAKQPNRAALLDLNCAISGISGYRRPRWLGDGHILRIFAELALDRIGAGNFAPAFMRKLDPIMK
ncbi:hypothetical protein [Methylocystis sp.]|uniref:hypothetical protein n=1 Tax=Methylocystis sp. TaxID=1911079 RepID=UPI003DA5022D